MTAAGDPARVPRVAMVTGGTRGIGFGIAQALVAEGWSLAVCGVRDEGEVGDALSVLRAGGGDVIYARCDVAVRADRERLVDTVRSRFGGLDALVNNAGRAPRVRADLLEASEESFEELLRTNLQGPYFLTQQVAPLLVATSGRHASRPSSIVFVTSVSAEMASTNRGDYCVSKAGLAMAVKLFALRLAQDRVSVFEVRPGIIRTDMTAGVAAAYDARIEAGLVPERRWGMPTDVGGAVAALLDGEIAYATGSVIQVDGGLSIPRL
jgi:NAD(P)-dependent dehydrogenase (short-subunit alcohol dehydrogenase family)